MATASAKSLAGTHFRSTRCYGSGGHAYCIRHATMSACSRAPVGQIQYRVGLTFFAIVALCAVAHADDRGTGGRRKERDAISGRPKARQRGPRDDLSKRRAASNADRPKTGTLSRTQRPKGWKDDEIAPPPDFDLDAAVEQERATDPTVREAASVKDGAGRPQSRDGASRPLGSQKQADDERHAKQGGQDRALESKALAATGVDPTQRATKVAAYLDYGTFDGGSRYAFSGLGNYTLNSWNIELFASYGVYSRSGEDDVWGLGDTNASALKTFGGDGKLAHVLGLSATLPPEPSSPLSSGSVRLMPIYGISFASSPRITWIAQVRYDFSLYTADQRSPVHQFVTRLSGSFLLPKDFFSAVDVRPLINFSSSSLGFVGVLTVGKVWPSAHPISLRAYAYIPIDTPTREQLGAWYGIGADYVL
jgi:hypothetical protein